MAVSDDKLAQTNYVYKSDGSRLTKGVIYDDGTGTVNFCVSKSQNIASKVSSHKSFVAQQIVVAGIAAGTHTIALDVLSGTSTDLNDFFNVTVTEFPF